MVLTFGAFSSVVWRARRWELNRRLIHEVVVSTSASSSTVVAPVMLFRPANSSRCALMAVKSVPALVNTAVGTGAGRGCYGHPSGPNTIPHLPFTVNLQDISWNSFSEGGLCLCFHSPQHFPVSQRHPSGLAPSCRTSKLLNALFPGPLHR